LHEPKSKKKPSLEKSTKGHTDYDSHVKVASRASTKRANSKTEKRRDFPTGLDNIGTELHKGDVDRKEGSRASEENQNLTGNLHSKRWGKAYCGEGGGGGKKKTEIKKKATVRARPWGTKCNRGKGSILRTLRNGRGAFG